MLADDLAAARERHAEAVRVAKAAEATEPLGLIDLRWREAAAAQAEVQELERQQKARAGPRTPQAVKVVLPDAKFAAHEIAKRIEAHAWAQAAPLRERITALEDRLARVREVARLPGATP